MKTLYPATSTITVHVPMRFSVHGGRKTIISEVVERQSRARIDNALLKGLARAHRWRQMIESGQYSSITELASAQKVNQSYACRLLRLTLLAPRIVADILDGRVRGNLMLKTLMRPLPVHWERQLEVLKIDRV
jgi:hypothetical protein